MNYHQLFQHREQIRVGLIGTGAFGRSFLFQSRAISQIDVVAVCDRDVPVARRACLAAGISADRLAACFTAAEAQAAIERGQVAVLEDPLLMMGTSIGVVVESTGMPEAGARHGQAALEHGRHVVMVSKETDVVVGPILSKLARERGGVYTPADGDQPSLLLGLISWAETLGLEIVCAGKSSEQDFVVDSIAGTVSHGQKRVKVADTGEWDLWNIPRPELAGQTIDQRREALAEIPQVAVPDLAEMAIVINSTGYGYDAPRLRAPVARIRELPEVLRRQTAGGILESEGVIDIVNCLRRADEVSLAGGVFVVVTCRDKATWELLAEKGHGVSRDRTHALIYQPWHLLGVETATSILSAAVLKQPTGARVVRPRVDLGIRAAVSLKKGQKLSMGGHHHTIEGAEPELIPAAAHQPHHPIPFYLAANNILKTDVPAGTLLTYEMVDLDAASTLWKLKQLQDKTFLEDQL